MDTRPAKRQKTAASGLPPELVMKIFREAMKMTPGLAKVSSTSLNLDTATGEVTLQEPVKSLGEEVRPQGYSAIFDHPIVKQPEMAAVYISTNCSELELSFKDPASLNDFADVLQAHVQKDFDKMRMKIRIVLFADDKFEPLGYYYRQEYAHGFKERATAYVQDWVEAIFKMPNDTTVVVYMARPWVDYRELRGAFAPLNGYDVTVQIDERRWGIFDRKTSSSGDAKAQGDDSQEEEEPEPLGKSFHIALTVAAVTGRVTKQQRDVTMEQAQELADHGCRGFRDRSRQG